MATGIMNGASAMRCYGMETRFQLISLWRSPGFAVPTLLFPAMFYVFFGLLFDMGGAPVHMPTYLIGTFGTFGVMAPALFGFGVVVASERSEGWLRLKLASPMPPAAYLIAKLVTAMAFAFAVVLVLFTLAAVFGEVRLRTGRWLLVAGVLTLGSLPFCAMGLAIGLRAGAQSAPAIVNLLYLPMAFLSGLWVPIQAFPSWLQDVAVWLPPYHLARLALQSVGIAPAADAWQHLAVLAAYTLAFVLLALAGWRKLKEE